MPSNWFTSSAKAAVAALQAADTAAANREMLLQDGVFAPQAYFGTTSSPNLTANRVFYARFILPKAITAKSISFGLQVADTTDDTVNVGLYSAAGSRLVDSGAVAGKLNGAVGSVSKVTIADTALLANTVYYAAFLAPVVTLATTAVAYFSPGNVGLSAPYGAGMPTAFMLWETSATLPLTATPTAPTSTNAGPLLFIRST